MKHPKIFQKNKNNPHFSVAACATNHWNSIVVSYLSLVHQFSFKKFIFKKYQNNLVVPEKAILLHPQAQMSAFDY
jgi:hypothetical protein